MSKKIKVVALILFAMLMGVKPCSSSATKKVDESNRVIIRMVYQVRHCTEGGKQMKLAEALKAYTVPLDKSKLTDATLKAIADLLQLKNDGVNFWVAQALGSFGPRASFALPALYKIFLEERCGIGETTSFYSVLRAIRSIGGEVPTQKECRHGRPID